MKNPRPISAKQANNLFKPGESGKHKTYENIVNVDDDCDEEENQLKCYKRLTKGGELDILELIPEPGEWLFLF